MYHPKLVRIFENLSEIAHAGDRIANYKLAAALRYKNRIIAYGVPSYKSSPFQKKFGIDDNHIFLHAEISAIKNTLRHIDAATLSRCSLYVCRVKQSGWGMAKPCGGCQRAIAEFGIKKVYFTSGLDEIDML